MTATAWHTRSVNNTYAALGTNEEGLSQKEAQRRQAIYGPNKLPEGKADSIPVIFLRQFISPLIAVLLVAAVAVLLIGHTTDAFIIFAVLIFNAVAGAILEGRAQNTLRALKRFTQTRATVLRGGTEYSIPDSALVPGDIILLQEGQKVPADARMVVCNNLAADEAALTGESAPVRKTAKTLHRGELPVSGRKNMVFLGSLITGGSGQAVVAAIGPKTAMGKISREIAGIKTEIPLQANIRALSRALLAFVAVIVGTIFAGGIAAGKTASEMGLTVVALAVSIIPEGLPVVITAVLAAGVWRMAKKKVLVKKLAAVEGLGQTRLLLVDKTGTLTKNQLVVRRAFVDGHTYAVSGVGYDPAGRVHPTNADASSADASSADASSADKTALLALGAIAAANSSARIFYSKKEKKWLLTGDPTEAALMTFARKLNMESRASVRSELSFDYTNRFRAALTQGQRHNTLLVAGAPETILKLSSAVWHAGTRTPLSARAKKKLEAVFHGWSHEGLRVIALAQSATNERAAHPKMVRALTFTGFLAIQDALRPEVAGAMKHAHEAGIRVVMVTGDHAATARAIAEEAGIYHAGDTVLTGDDVARLSDMELMAQLPHTSVFARVTPRHKLRIIQMFKKHGEAVAMTGDGVNDAPSLVAADLGVAMGGIGTEVAKEAADIVLTDDNFGGVVAAAEEGRSIYKTIKKVILYLFSTSLGETLVIGGAVILGYPLPLLPAQIIWLNFVTDGFLDVALAMEPKEHGLMHGAFERSKKYFVDRLMLWRMIVMALPMMAGTLFLFKEFYAYDSTKAWTITLTTLAAFQWFNAYNCRHESRSLLRINLRSNRFLLGATALVVVLQMLAVYHPALQRLLKTTALSAGEWALCVGTAFSIIVAEELRKFFFRKYARNKKPAHTAGYQLASTRKNTAVASSWRS